MFHDGFKRDSEFYTLISVTPVYHILQFRNCTRYELQTFTYRVSLNIILPILAVSRQVQREPNVTSLFHEPCTRL